MTSIRALFLAGLLTPVAFEVQAVGVPWSATPGLQAGTPLPGTSVAAQPWLAGTVVADEVQQFSFAAITRPVFGIASITDQWTVSGTVQSRVVLADDGTHDFYWRISLDAPAPGLRRNDGMVPPVEEAVPARDIPISSFTLAGFHNGGSVDADWRTDGLGDVAPRSAVAGPTDDTISFRFARYCGMSLADCDNTLGGSLPRVAIAGTSDLGGGSSSRYFFIDTNATGYARNASMRLDVASASSALEDWYGLAGVSPALATFGPTAVPEPSTVVLALAGLAGLAARRRSTAGHRYSR